MKKRDATTRKRWWLRRAWMLLLPLVLAGLTWKIQQLHKPIAIEIPSPRLVRSGDGSFGVKRQKIPVFHQLMVRVQSEMQKHPFAASISVSQTIPYPEESGLDLSISQSLEWERKDRLLRYTTGNYGWTYSHVEQHGMDVLAKARLEENPITLPITLHHQLRSYGWTLTEHYLP